MANGANGESPVLTLKDKRAALSADARRIVRTVCDHMESELIGALPEMLAGVKATSKQASISPTISFNWKKHGNLDVKVDARLRTPREGLNFQAHITDDGQLALGWNEPPDPPADGDASAGGVGFDATKTPAGEGASSDPVH